MDYMPIQSQFRKVAPWWDRYDTIFTAIVLGLVVIGYVTFIETLSISGLIAAWQDFIDSSGLIALLTAWTAIIGLYRLRHRPNKTRPSVREDFDASEQKGATDFGLRNFGPGPALYVQGIATVEQGDDSIEVARLDVHEDPIHLHEGEFASFVHNSENDWIDNIAEDYDIDQSEADTIKEKQGKQPMINLYYSYVSQSGAREPTQISADREDEDLISDLYDPDSEARNIELSRVIEECRMPSD